MINGYLLQEVQVKYFLPSMNYIYKKIIALLLWLQSGKDNNNQSECIKSAHFLFAL